MARRAKEYRFGIVRLTGWIMEALETYDHKRLPDRARMLLMILVLMADKEKGEVIVSKERLASRMGRDPDTVWRAIEDLKRLGLIEVDYKWHQVSVYHLLVKDTLGETPDEPEDEPADEPEDEEPEDEEDAFPRFGDSK